MAGLASRLPARCVKTSTAAVRAVVAYPDGLVFSPRHQVFISFFSLPRSLYSHLLRSSCRSFPTQATGTATKTTTPLLAALTEVSIHGSSVLTLRSGRDGDARPGLISMCSQRWVFDKLLLVACDSDGFVRVRSRQYGLCLAAIRPGTVFTSSNNTSNECHCFNAPTPLRKCSTCRCTTAIISQRGPATKNKVFQCLFFNVPVPCVRGGRPGLPSPIWCLHVSRHGFLHFSIDLNTPDRMCLCCNLYYQRDRVCPRPQPAAVLARHFGVGSVCDIHFAHLIRRCPS